MEPQSPWEPWPPEWLLRATGFWRGEDMAAQISERDLERVAAARAHLEAEGDSRTPDRAGHHAGELLGVIARPLAQPPALLPPGGLLGAQQEDGSTGPG